MESILYVVTHPQPLLARFEVLDLNQESYPYELRKRDFISSLSVLIHLGSSMQKPLKPVGRSRGEGC